MADILSRLAECERSGQAVCLCIVVETQGAVPRHAGSKMLVFPDGSTEGTVGGGGVETQTLRAALEAFQVGQARLIHYTLNANDSTAVGVCGGEMTVYIEPHLAKPTLLIIGAGHVGQAVAKFAQFLPFRVVLADDREELLGPRDGISNLEFLPVPMEKIPQHLLIDQQTYVVAVTRGAEVDIDGLPALLETHPAYIGLIGSKRRWAYTHDQLLQRGLSEEQLSRIKTPIGLNIKAETPEEIAISILAEIIQVRNSGRTAIQENSNVEKLPHP
jgi:xanthine dehydrogenase accessory factor